MRLSGMKPESNSGLSHSTQKKRPIGRKLAKESLKSGGDARSYKEIIQDIL
jgi:hypothetical protein